MQSKVLSLSHIAVRDDVGEIKERVEQSSIFFSLWVKEPKDQRTKRKKGKTQQACNKMGQIPAASDGHIRIRKGMHFTVMRKVPKEQEYLKGKYIKE